MPYRRRSVGYGLGALALVGGFSNLVAAPSPDHVFATWSLGPAIAAVAILWRDRIAWSLIAALAAGASYFIVDRPWDVAVLGGVGSGLLTWWGAGLVRGPDGLVLRDEPDLQRLLRATLLTGLAAGLLGLAMEVVWGRDLSGLMPFSFAITTAASVLALVPLVAGLPEHAALAGRHERVAQWSVVVVLTGTAVLPAGPQQLALFLLLPALGWGASRLTPRHAMGQLYGCLLVLAVSTYVEVGALQELAELYRPGGKAIGLGLIGFALLAAVVSVTVVVRTNEEIHRAAEVERQRDLVQQVLDATTGVAIIGSDDAGTITHFNVGAERLLGWSADEVLGRPRSLLHPDGVLEPLVATGLGAGGAGLQVQLVRRDREVRTHLMAVARLQDSDGRAHGHLTTSEDITEVVETNHLLTQALERQRQLDEAKDAFVSSVSHELRTPLTSIVGNLEMVEDGDYGEVVPPLSSAVERVARNSRRLLALVDDLLLLSQIEKQGMVGDGVVDLTTVLRGVCDRARSQYPAAEVVCDLPGEPVMVPGRANELGRALEHLVVNAVKFSPEHPGARVHLVRGAQDVTVEVVDDGIGIPDEEQSVVFERFARGHAATLREIQGAGLGLTIVADVIGRHRGALSMTSAEGVGSTFVVVLPLGGGDALEPGGVGDEHVAVPVGAGRA